MSAGRPTTQHQHHSAIRGWRHAASLPGRVRDPDEKSPARSGRLRQGKFQYGKRNVMPEFSRLV